MVRLRISFITLFVVLTLRPGLVPDGIRPAAAQAAPPDLAVAPFPGVSLADGWNLYYVGHIGGPTYAVAVEGNLAYVGEGFRLTVLDISVPGSPTVLGKTALMPAMVRGVAVAEGYAYVAAGEAGLGVVDVSVPSAPSEVSFYDTPGVSKDVAVAGGFAYVADGEAGLRVVDVSTPWAPVEGGVP